MIALRAQLNDVLAEDSRVSFNDLLAKCVCMAVKKVPYINAQYVSDEEIRLYRHVNIGIAAALPDGLVVPVVKNADTLTLAGLARQSAKLVGEACLLYTSGTTVLNGVNRIQAVGRLFNSPVLVVVRIRIALPGRMFSCLLYTSRRNAGRKRLHSLRRQSRSCHRTNHQQTI